MSTDSATRLELLAESTEDLFNAMLDLRLKREASGMRESRAVDAVAEAREAYRSALAAFIEPVVRVVEGGLAGQLNPADEPFRCDKCGSDHRCKLNCEHWHATIAKQIDEADEVIPVCTVCDLPDDPSVMCCEKACPRRADRGPTRA